MTGFRITQRIIYFLMRAMIYVLYNIFFQLCADCLSMTLTFFASNKRRYGGVLIGEQLLVTKMGSLRYSFSSVNHDVLP